MSDRGDEAIRALEHVADLDPLYRPAAFLLGCAHLARGDGAAAAKTFEALALQFEGVVRQGISELRHEWRGGTSRLGQLVKAFPVLKKWFEYWADALPLAMGGRLVIASEVWAELTGAPGYETVNIAVDGSSASEESSWILLNSAINDDELVDAASGRKTSQKFTKAEARDYLNLLLSPDKIRLFDVDLLRLDAECIVASMDVKRTAELAKARESLREGVIADRLRPGLNQLQAALDEKRWQDSRKLILKLRGYTMSPSLERFAVLLDDPAVDSLDAVIASWFLPPLGKLRKLRAEIRQPLLLETEYHLALALFLTFEQSGLIQAWDRAQKLRRSRLQRRARSGPERDLQFLAISLEINALSRLAENVVYPDVIRYRSREGLDESINPSLQMFSTGLDWKDIPLNKLVRGLPGEVAAAVRTALGLLIRRERREKPERRHRSFDPTPEDKIFQEIQHYRASLDLHESSTPHCYLAECLIELDRKAEAIAHVKQALLLAPLHRLARELEVKLGTTRDPAT